MNKKHWTQLLPVGQKCLCSIMCSRKNEKELFNYSSLHNANITENLLYLPVIALGGTETALKKIDKILAIRELKFKC
jgi:hypothetical protein